MNLDITGPVLSWVMLCDMVNVASRLLCTRRKVYDHSHMFGLDHDVVSSSHPGPSGKIDCIPLDDLLDHILRMGNGGVSTSAAGFG